MPDESNPYAAGEASQLTRPPAKPAKAWWRGFRSGFLWATTLGAFTVPSLHYEVTLGLRQAGTLDAASSFHAWVTVILIWLAVPTLIWCLCAANVERQRAIRKWKAIQNDLSNESPGI